MTPSGMIVPGPSMTEDERSALYRAPSTDTQIDVRSATIEAIPLRAPSVKIEARPSPSRPRDGQILPAEPPRYEVVEEIHRGGMGEILLARLITPSGFSRPVVLKGLLSQLSADNVSYALFMREARLMGQLEHPNIVRVFDLPTVEGRPYLAMELVRGRNLHQVIHRSSQTNKQISPAIALTIVSETLRGLHCAHRLRGPDGKTLGVVHRDVSPGNILLSFHGEIKVTDFGIAKLADSPKYTGPRSIRGKARYVAPEQVQGQPATVASDIYAAGVVLAETLTGAPLWERGSVAETLMAIVTEDRADILDRILRDLPRVAGLRAVLRRTLSMNPADRPSSALQLAEILEAIVVNQGPRPTTVDIGRFLRTLFHDAPDLPQSDEVGPSGQSSAIIRDRLDEDQTAPAFSDPSLGDHSLVASQPTRVGALADDDTRVPPTIVPFATAEIAEAAAVVAPLGLPVVEASNLDDRIQTLETPDASPNIGLLVTGIFIGASLAIMGCLLALRL
ncbi:MAG: serine/threonine-protein kinase [Myxococcota bacterium]